METKVTFWCFFLCCGSICTWQALQCLKKYSNYPTSTRIEVKSWKEAPFPRFTICLDNNIRHNTTYSRGNHGMFLNETVLKECGLDYKNYQLGGPWASEKCPNASEVWQKAMYGLDIMVRSVVIKFRNGRKFYVPIDNNTGGYWRSFTKRKNKCFTLIIPEPFRAEGLKRMIFAFRDRVVLEVHTPGVVITSEITKSIIIDDSYMGQEAFADLSYEIFNALEYGGLICDESSGYSKDVCAIQKIDRAIGKKYGCSPPFYKSQLEICTNTSYGEKARNEYFSIFENTESRGTLIESCRHPCTYFDVRLLLRKKQPKKKRDIARLKMDFTPTVKVTSAFYSYSFISMVAEFGGYVGLFLGMSIIQLSKVVDRIIFRCRYKYSTRGKK